DDFLKRFELQSEQERRFDLLGQLFPSLSAEGRTRLSEQPAEAVTILRGLRDYNIIQVQLQSWTAKTLRVKGISAAALANLNVFNVWLAARNASIHAKGRSSKDQSEMLRAYLAAAVVSSNKINPSIRSLIAVAVFHVSKQDTEPFSGVSELWSDVLAFAGARGILSNDPMLIAAQLRTIRDVLGSAEWAGISGKPAVSELIKLCVVQGESSATLKAAVQLYASSADKFRIDSLDEAAALARRGVTLTSIEGLKKALAGHGFIVRNARELLEVGDVLGVFDAQLKFDFMAGLDAVGALLAKDGTAWILKDVYGLPRHRFAGSEGDQVTVGYSDGAWQIKVTAQNGIRHAIEMRGDRIDHKCTTDGEESLFRLVRTGDRVRFEEMPGIDGEVPGLDLLNLDSVLEVSARPDAGRFVFSVDVIGRDGARESIFEAGAMQAVTDARGSAEVSLVSNPVLSGQHKNASTRLLVRGRPVMIAEQFTDVDGSTKTREQELMLPPNVRVGTVQGSVAVIEILDFAKKAAVGSFSVDLLTGKVVDEGSLLKGLMSIASYQDLEPEMAPVDRDLRILEHSTGYKLLLGQTVYAELAKDPEKGKAFISWWNRNAGGLSEPVLVEAVQAEFAGLEAILQGFKALFDETDPKMLAYYASKSDLQVAQRRLRDARFALDSEEAIALMDALHAAFAASDRASAEAVMKDSPDRIVRRLMAKIDDPAMRKQVNRVLSMMAASKEKQGLEVSLKDLRDIFQKAKLDAELLKALDPFIAFGDFVSAAVGNNEILRAATTSLGGRADPKKLGYYLGYLASHAQAWDLLQYKRREHFIKRSETEKNGLWTMYEEAQRTGDYTVVAEAFADQFMNLNRAQLLAPQRGAFIKTLAELFASDGYDRVTFSLQAGSEVAPLRVTEARVKELVEQGKSREEAQAEANREWRGSRGYSDPKVPTLIFHGDAAKKLGRYWYFVGKEWAQTTGAESFVDSDFDTGKAGVAEMFAHTGLVVIDDRWLEQSYFHEEQHIVFQRPYVVRAKGDPRVEEVYNYFAQILSRTIDLETGRAYDVQMIYNKMKSYAKNQGFDYDVMKGAFDAILYLYQNTDEAGKVTIMNLIRHTQKVEELLAWHAVQPMDIKKEFDAIYEQAFEPRTELKEEVPEPAEVLPEADLGVAGLAADVPATPEAFVDAVKANLLAAAPGAGIELSEAAKRLQMMTPVQDPRLQGKLGFYTDPVGADAFGIMALNSQKAEAFYQKIQGKTVLTLEERGELQDIMAELLVALAHENEHAKGRAEVRAYQKSIDVAKLVKMPKFDLLYILLRQARAEETELKRVQDALQLVDQNGMMVRRDALDVLSNLNNSRTVAIMSPELAAINGVESVGDVAGLGKYLKDTKYTASANHTVFFIEDAKLKMPGMPEALERLRKAGFPIFVYSESDIGGGADRVFYLGQFAAWVGVEEFRRLMPEMYHENRNGYFSVTAYLSNALIRTLLNEIMAEQQVAQAA
ncbi:MAG TPA: hypothetical protein PLY30_00755, partial [Candidatus Omnitrophota bacterium]|nr:hypothetical protein [Candidatus Omnitrophota bacterium]